MVPTYAMIGLKFIPMNVIIIEDNPIAVQQLTNLLQQMDDHIEITLLKYKRTNSNLAENFSGAGNDFTKIFSSSNQKKRFLTRVGTRLTSIPAENIAYFYTKDKLLYIKTKNNEDLLYDKCLEEVESEMDSENFFRVNRQFIINYDAIAKVHSWFGGKLKIELVPLPYEDIIVSRYRATEFKKWLGE